MFCSSLLKEYLFSIREQDTKRWISISSPLMSESESSIWARTTVLWASCNIYKNDKICNYRGWSFTDISDNRWKTESKVRVGCKSACRLSNCRQAKISQVQHQISDFPIWCAHTTKSTFIILIKIKQIKIDYCFLDEHISDKTFVLFGSSMNNWSHKAGSFGNTFNLSQHFKNKYIFSMVSIYIYIYINHVLILLYSNNKMWSTLGGLPFSTQFRNQCVKTNK